MDLGHCWTPVAKLLNYHPIYMLAGLKGLRRVHSGSDNVVSFARQGPDEVQITNPAQKKGKRALKNGNGFF